LLAQVVRLLRLLLGACKGIAGLLPLLRGLVALGAERRKLAAAEIPAKRGTGGDSGNSDKKKKQRIHAFALWNEGRTYASRGAGSRAGAGKSRV
jgi:hypothetical protein